MAGTVSYQENGGVAVLRLQGLEGNAITLEMCEALAEALERAQASTSVGAVLIAGTDAAFSVGFPVGAITRDAVAQVSDLCRKIENCPLPVVAAVSGSALGFGLELVMACHYRLAVASARIGFPDVGLGILPGAGGTQRLPRLVGGEAALQVLMAGAPLAVTSPNIRRMFDQIVGADVHGTALAFATALADMKGGPRKSADSRAGFEDAAEFDAALAHWRAKPAPFPNASTTDILECVEASRLLPFEAGLAFEWERFEARVATETFRALRHMVVSERRAAMFPELKDGRAGAIKQVGVIGVGSVGSAFAIECLMAGYSVVVVERNAKAMAQGMRRIHAVLEQSVKNGRLAAADRDRLEASLHQADDLVAVAEADFVLEASGQVPEIERQIFVQLDGVSKEGAVLAAHGPAVDVARLASETGGPDEVIGLHFPVTASGGQGVEVVVGDSTSADTVATVVSLLKRLRKRPVRVAPHDGLITHTVWAAAVRAAEHMVLAGADPYEVDRQMRAWGMTGGPFQVADKVAINAPWFEAAGVTLSRTVRDRTSHGAGWYGPNAIKEDLHQWLTDARHASGRPQQEFSPTQITTRILAATANAGVGLLRIGVIRAPRDVDVAMVAGAGFPRWRGGPMMAAQAEGLVRIRATLREMQAEGDSLSAPDPVFDHLIKNGGFLAR